MTQREYNSFSHINRPRGVGETEYELFLLRSSRPLKLLASTKQVLRNPFSIKNNLSSALSAIKKTNVDSIHRYSRYRSPINNPYPLFKYPNISVGLLTDEFSSVDNIFLQTCNASALSEASINSLLVVGGLTLVVTDSKALNDETNLAQAIEAHASGAQIVMLSSSKKQPVEPRVKKIISYTLTVGLSNTSNIRPYADIYGAKQQYPKFEPDAVNQVNRLGAADNITSIEHNSISVITQSFLKEISFRDACALLTKIASYCPVIIEGLKPGWIPDCVITYSSQEEQDAIVKKLLKPYELERYAISCGRNVVLYQNSLQTADVVLPKLGVPQRKVDNLKISVVAPTKRAANIKDIIENIERQSLRPTEIILALHGIKLTKNIRSLLSKSRLNIIPVPISADTMFGDVLNIALDRVTGDFVSKIDDDDLYGENHLLDLYAAYLSSRADIIGKCNNWTYLASDNITVNYAPYKSCIYTDYMPGATLFMKTSILRGLRFGRVKRAIDSDLLRRAKARGAISYSTHKYNFVRVRHDDHTYEKGHRHFIDKSDHNFLKGTAQDVVNT